MECSTQTDAGEDDGDGHLFYIPLQPGKQTTTNHQIIQGVAVKVGTEESNGQNQRVVMRAKLVTQTPDRLPILGPQQKPFTHSTLMYPPVGTVQPTYRPKPSSEPIKPVMKSIATESNVLKDIFTSTEIKTAVPSSPSASSSSSAKIYKRAVKPKARALDMCVPINSTEFPHIDSPAQLVEAPTFHPTEKEFQDPLEFIEKIRAHAEKFGICRIVPPANFKRECKVSDDMRFTAYNQYIHKMLHRWGPNFKELMAIKKYLATQNITFTHPPWIGGLKEVIDKKRWPKVAEGMKIPKSAQDRVTKLDDIYCKYLLPYDTLSPAEREKLFDEVETEWAKRESRSALLAAQNSSANVSTNSNESDSESGDDELEECTVKGRNMALNVFYRIARNTMSMWFKSPEPSAQKIVRSHDIRGI
ncbi:Jumonji AT rich interactive domain 2 [Carabus blaptoides fortunei]